MAILYSPPVIQDAIHTMNRLGASGTPFLCLIDVENRYPQVWPISELNAASIRFQTPLGGFPVSEPDDQSPGTDGSQTPAHAVPHLSIKQPLCRHRYRQGFHIIQDGLRRGDSFLANLTFPVDIETDASLLQIYQAAHAPYRLWLRGRCTVFSPEPFVMIDSRGMIATFPMKGTIAADLPDARTKLLLNPKEAAEHLTVVDLLRNDLGRIGRGVQVQRYRYIERIHSPTGDILQASSEIRADLGTAWRSRIGDLLYELLPAGSITGAPKCRTMELIAEAEQEPRGYYTGIIGYFDGDGFTSGVMIRFIEQCSGGLPGGKALPGLRFRTGGGITIYSREEEEYDELHAKIRIPVR